MKIVCMSDVHGNVKNVKIPEGDVLLLCGDIVKNYSWDRKLDSLQQVTEVLELDNYLGNLGFKKIFFVSGNHEFFTRHNREAIKEFKNIIYLEDSGYTYEGIKIWGSPWQRYFGNWNFNFPEEDEEKGYPIAKKTWDKIPLDTDILLLHTPPYKILDQIAPGEGIGRNFKPLGDIPLSKRLKDLNSLKCCVFGHIHGSAGRKQIGNTVYINAAICDEDYMAVNPPQVVEIENDK